MLSTLGAKTDCVIIHWYPAGFPPNPDVAAMLNYPKQIAGIVSGVKSVVQQYAGLNPANVPILITETDSNVASDVQPSALFAADEYMTFFENGVTNVDWWNQHNGPGTPSIINGAQDYGDGGIFSSGTNGSGVTEPPLDTPFAPYYGIQMLTRLGTAGDTMVSSASGNPLVKVHAVRRTGGGLTVLVANEDPTTSYTANLTLNGFTPSGSPTVYTFANNAHAITSSTASSATSVTVAPYTLTVLQIPGSGGAIATVPGSPGQPNASNLASTTAGNNTGTATLTWAAATAGTYPVANYQVYRVDGAGSTLVATQTGTSLNLTGLTIGASYSYYVVAVDTHGTASLASSPGTFTIPPPANASCAVHYAINNSWPGGFGGSITITNRAATAINGWTLTFTWPAAGEAVQSGWNGTWTQSGQNVTVASASWNGTIAANGGTLGLGFNGVDTGAYPAPAAFFLNGAVCSNT